MTDKLVAYCGLTCIDCSAYIAKRTDDSALQVRTATQWRRPGFVVSSEEVRHARAATSRRRRPDATPTGAKPRLWTTPSVGVARGSYALRNTASKAVPRSNERRVRPCSSRSPTESASSRISSGDIPCFGFVGSRTKSFPSALSSS